MKKNTERDESVIELELAEKAFVIASQTEDKAKQAKEKARARLLRAREEHRVYLRELLGA